MTFSCPLCSSFATEPFHADKRRQYYRCQECALVFVHPDSLPDIQREKQEYDLHINSMDDPGYRRFLSKVSEPLCELIKPGAQGLDFGCGPGPLLAKMLQEKGYQCAAYDPIYAAEQAPLQQKYDFITCTEAVEHFHTPHKEWDLFSSLLHVDGLLAVMTKRVIDRSRFASWHYINDPTHVSFYSEHTFTWLQNRFAMKLEYLADDVVIMRKKIEI